MPRFNHAGKSSGFIPASMKPTDLTGVLHRLMSTPHKSCAHLLVAWAAAHGERVKCVRVKGEQKRKMYKLVFPRVCRRVISPQTGDVVLLKNDGRGHVGVFIRLGDDERVLHAATGSPAMLEPLARLESRMRIVGFYSYAADVDERELAGGEWEDEDVGILFSLFAGAVLFFAGRYIYRKVRDYLNDLLNPPVPEYSGAANPSPSLSAPGNRQTPYAPPPVACGEYLMYPVLGSLPYKYYQPVMGEFVENLYLLFDFGMGDIVADDLKIGDTPASQLTNVTLTNQAGNATPNTPTPMAGEMLSYPLSIFGGWQAFFTAGATVSAAPLAPSHAIHGGVVIGKYDAIVILQIRELVTGVSFTLPRGCVLDTPAGQVYTTATSMRNVYDADSATGLRRELSPAYAAADTPIRIVYTTPERPTITIRRIGLNNPVERRRFLMDTVWRSADNPIAINITANGVRDYLANEGHVSVDGVDMSVPSGSTSAPVHTRVIKSQHPITGLAFNITGMLFDTHSETGAVLSRYMDIRITFRGVGLNGNIVSYTTAASRPAGVTVSPLFPGFGGLRFTNNNRDAFRRTIFTTRAFPANLKEITVTMQRGTIPPDSTQVTATLSVDTIQAITAAIIAPRENQNIVAMVATADDILNGRVERVNARVRAKCPIYQNNAWTADNHFTSNPAAWMRYFLRGLRDSAGALQLGAGLAAEQINDAELATWYAFCITHNLRFDAVFERTLPISEMAQRIAAAGRALVSFASGKAGVVPLGPNTAPVLALSAANIKKDSLKITFSPRRAFEGIEAVFRDGAKEYQQETLRETMPGVLRPERFRRLDLFGVTQRAQAVKAAKLAAARMRYSEPFKYSFQLSNMELAISAGDVVTLEHDLLGAGAGVLRLRVDAVEFRESGVRVSASPDPAELYTAF